MLTVLIATRNGMATLPMVLDAYCRLVPPAQGWRLLLVDNGSSDGSAALIASYAARLPLRCLAEPRAGKNHALNLALGVALAQAGSDEDLIVFSDDDAVPAPDWLLRWQACAAAHPAYTVFGGAIEPDWAEPPPDWLLRLVPTGLTYGLTAATLADGPVFPGLVWGANMAVRRAVFKAGHRFDTSVGPNGGAYAMGSETEFARRLARAGHEAWFCPGIRVAHHIRAHQLSSSYVLQKAWRFGRGKYRQDSPGVFPEWLGVPRWMLARYLREVYGYAGACLAGRAGAGRRFQRRWELAYLGGYFQEAWRGRFLGARGAARTVLITSYSGELGGMELRMAQEARYLQADGRRVTLALRPFAGFDAWADRLAAEHIVVAGFDPPPFFEQWAWRRFNLLRARLLAARRLRAFRADLVHVAWCWTNYGASALWLAHHCRLPAVLSVHNAFAPAEFGDWHQPLLRQAFSTVRGIYAVSESAMAHFMAIYQTYLAPGTRLAVIPNSVDTARFLPSAARRAAMRRQWGIADEALVIGAVARLSDQKRPALALALLAALRPRFPRLYLVLAGTGPLEAALREQAGRMGLARYVIFTGFVAEVEQVLPALDVHVLMSRNEGFGIATIEAMACGVPAVATDVPGSADILRGCGGGLLIPANERTGGTAATAAEGAPAAARPAGGADKQPHQLDKPGGDTAHEAIRRTSHGLVLETAQQRSPYILDRELDREPDRDPAASGPLPVATALIGALLADPARRARMGRLGRKEAERRYDTTVVGRLVREFYDGLL